MSPSPNRRRKKATSNSSRRPIAVAITGGIGAGKSEALKAFERHGAAVISSDDIVHRLLRDDEAVKRAIVQRLGPEILDDEEEIDRSRVARVVFGDREALLWLEQLLHPLVSLEYLRWRDELAQGPDPPALTVTEVPLLYEVGSAERFDKVVLITAPPMLAAARARVSADERSDRLIPDEEKARRADFVYVNDGTLDELDAFVAGVVKELR
jgi:dephospho-CoA kinase